MVASVVRPDDLASPGWSALLGAALCPAASLAHVSSATALPAGAGGDRPPPVAVRLAVGRHRLGAAREPAAARLWRDARLVRPPRHLLLGAARRALSLVGLIFVPRAIADACARQPRHGTAHAHEPHPPHRRRRHRRLQGRRADPPRAQGGPLGDPRADRGRRAFRHPDEPRRARREPGLHLAVGPQGRGRDGPHPASRAADLVLVCPATADLIAKMAAGIADDLATTLLLATDKPVVVVPAMNVRMWQHAATQANIATLRARGVTVLDPDEGPMACGEYGPGRLPEPAAILDYLHTHTTVRPEPVEGPSFRSAEKKNSPSTSSGRTDSALLGQAHPRHRRPDPRTDRPGAGHRQPLVGQAGLRHRRRRRRRRRARDARSPARSRSPPPAAWRGSTSRPREKWPTRSSRRCRAMSPILVAAVADWRVEPSPAKLKKSRRPAAAELRPQPRHPRHARRAPRPPAPADRLRRRDRTTSSPTPPPSAPPRSADWIVANDVSGDVMGGARNRFISSPPTASRTGPRRPRKTSPPTSSPASPRNSLDPHRHQGPTLAPLRPTRELRTK